MILRRGVFVLLATLVPSEGTSAFDMVFMPACELAKDLGAYQNKAVTVRGVYYYGLRQECQQKCATGIWPSFLNLRGGKASEWAELAKTINKVENEAKVTHQRFEIWVTVSGRLKTIVKHSSRGPCDRRNWGLGGYGHLGAFPSEITVETIREIEVRVNPKSPYDYANMYHGAL